MSSHPVAAMPDAAPQITLQFDATPSPEGAATLQSLRAAVAQALERKRRLGQYAVVWQDGHAVELTPDDHLHTRQPV